jgi:uncharacterized protein with PIN domain
MKKEKKKCPDCGGEMVLVTALTATPKIAVGEPLKPLRYVCSCGRLVKI